MVVLGGYAHRRCIPKARKPSEAPLRKIVREFNGDHGVEKEELECGHVVNRKHDIYGATNAYARRCKQCAKAQQQEARP